MGQGVNATRKMEADDYSRPRIHLIPRVSGTCGLGRGQSVSDLVRRYCPRPLRRAYRFIRRVPALSHAAHRFSSVRPTPGTPVIRANVSSGTVDESCSSGFGRMLRIIPREVDLPRGSYRVELPATGRESWTLRLSDG